MEINLETVSQEENKLLYSPKNEQDTECIGRLRGDFGRGGNEFWTTWHDFCPEIKTKIFNKEIDDLINTMRDGGVLKDFNTMSAFCAKNPQAKIPETRSDNYGFKIKTNNYVYYLRCILRRGDYNFYCYVYKRK